jgi:hypothetical protein
MVNEQIRTQLVIKTNDGKFWAGKPQSFRTYIAAEEFLYGIQRTLDRNPPSTSVRLDLANGPMVFNATQIAYIGQCFLEEDETPTVSKIPQLVPAGALT